VGRSHRDERNTHEEFGDMEFSMPYKQTADKNPAFRRGFDPKKIEISADNAAFNFLGAYAPKPKEGQLQDRIIEHLIDRKASQFSNLGRDDIARRARKRNSSGDRVYIQPHVIGGRDTLESGEYQDTVIHESSHRGYELMRSKDRIDVEDIPIDAAGGRLINEELAVRMADFARGGTNSVRARAYLEKHIPDKAKRDLIKEHGNLDRAFRVIDQELKDRLKPYAEERDVRMRNFRRRLGKRN